jgi:hypothetical protein
MGIRAAAGFQNPGQYGAKGRLSLPARTMAAEASTLLCSLT